jgi:hypothetical protein
MTIRQAAKAIYGGLVAALSGLSAVLVGGTSFGDVSAGQWVSIVLAGLIAGGGVYGISNAPKAP